MSTPDNVRPLRPDISETPTAATTEPVEPVRATSWNADDLMAIEFPEPAWAVPGLIPEGVTLLVGAPKIGKSWISLGLGISIASGGTAFGSIDVDAGPVLYLALEDTPRRLKTRMSKILAGQPAPHALTLATECPPLPQGGDTAIARWLGRNPDARMVIIDVFAKVRGTPPNGVSAYEADYAAVTRAKKLADHYSIAIVLIHHVRKAGSDDFLTEVSGTNGLAGAADTVMVLKRGRGQADGILHVTGRDVDEDEKALSFESDTGTWHLLDGPATDHTMHDTRTTILRHVRDNPGNTPQAIASATGVSSETVRQTCSRMAKDGQLIRNAGSRYSASSQPEQPDTPPGVTPVTLSLDDV